MSHLVLSFGAALLSVALILATGRRTDRDEQQRRDEVWAKRHRIGGLS